MNVGICAGSPSTGFIEEDTGRGTRRERWRRVVEEERVVETVEFRHDPDTRGALAVFVHQLVEQHFGRVTDYLAEDWADEWRRAGAVSDRRELRLTPARLAALTRSWRP